MVSITRYVILIMIGLSVHILQAQEYDYKKDVEALEQKKSEVTATEKQQLKKEVIAIDERLSAGEITEEESNQLKQEAAEKRALNIKNKIAIIDNKIALLERNKTFESIEEEIEGSIIKFGNVFSIGGNGYKKKKLVYDKRTKSYLVYAIGFNNVIHEDKSLSDSDYKVAGSRFFELGYTWNTRVFKESNWLRFKYGVSLQYNGLKPTDNRYFVKNGDVTSLETFSEDLKKSKIRFTNLVVPVFFEFGPSKKVEGEDYFRYSTRRKFKVGIGAYGGLRIGTKQKLKYKVDGDRKKDKIKSDFNGSDFVYGISGYVGLGGLSIYGKYDLNPLFKSPNAKQNNISLGLRFEVF